MAPHEFRAAHKRTINGSLRRTPANRRVSPIQPGLEASDIHEIYQPRGVVALRKRNAEVDVGAVTEVLISAKVSNIGQITAFVRVEQIIGISAIHLSGCFEEDPAIRDQPCG